ncbi:hypothetical protein Taro_009298 [Colocasia esculenta]|uniref:Uncharacterized protein n=1 Tax=Colocasia esculenta TaxID=4460 RepID=A0A843U9G8_COLES|nr:hypothetical protein [Colocasia esculenta]
MQESIGEGGGGETREDHMEESIGGGGGTMRFSDEIALPVEGLNKSEIYHVAKEVIGFVLYMHQQIPAVLQHLEKDFDNLREEYKDLEESVLPPEESKACSLRMRKLKIREVKQGIKRLAKLMNTISSLLSSLQLMLDEIPVVHGLMLLLGGSLIRPQFVYEIFFLRGKADSGNPRDSNKSKVAESVSKKVVRSLITKGAGGGSYAGPMKLFLLVKGPDNLKLPLHFLPKREFKYHKKAVSFRLQIRCSAQKRARDNSRFSAQEGGSTELYNTTSGDLIWFQCKHIVKGLATKAPSAE